MSPRQLRESLLVLNALARSFASATSSLEAWERNARLIEEEENDRLRAWTRRYL